MRRRRWPAPRSCRNIPGSPGYPSPAKWSAFNASISGRLVAAVPSAKWCADRGGCTDAEWGSAQFRLANIPGAMDHYNFEQGYDLNPETTCLRNGTTCGQGNVPLYSVEAETAEDVQTAVKFAAKNNLRLVIKSSGHDFLGRSTAPFSLLIRMNKFNNTTFLDAFEIGNKNMGPVVTVGSGAHAGDLYMRAKERGRLVVLGTAATVCAGGGYVQGGGHSTLAPKFGMAADNALEFLIVVASGELLRVNHQTNTDLFYALRGGGSGTWGVIISTTFRTFPSFNSTLGDFTLLAPNNTVMAALMQVHAAHIFDFDATRSSQYFYVVKENNPPPPTADGPSELTLFTVLVNQTQAEAEALMAPFFEEALSLPGVQMLESTYTYEDTNDIPFLADDEGGVSYLLGSRLVPEDVYRENIELVGPVYKEMLDAGVLRILGHLVAGGQVADNAKISSGLNPAWRKAKTHVIIQNEWFDSTPLDQVDSFRKLFHEKQLPILEKLSGPNAGAYANEADLLESDFRQTFYGEANYKKLTAIKRKYDPEDLFIVPAGVGSERWDAEGICRV
ncbi:FAD-binding domain-containing protein [Mycena kentingensis (nom. inval.)]|nr:FAD-binding domain-containing protein [Mycena kentingensis (nom. inval.)]